MSIKSKSSKKKRNPSILNLIKEFDFFGQEINLNFKQNGDKYKTAPGGLISLMIICMFTFYIIHHINVLLGREENNENSYTQI